MGVRVWKDRMEFRVGVGRIYFGFDVDFYDGVRDGEYVVGD